MRKKICLILAICWMVVIFSFSAREASLSAKDSASVGTLIGKILIPHFNEWDQEKQTAFAEKVDYPVRKTAHATEYAVLGFLIAGSFCDGTRRRRVSAGVPWLAGTAYAISDEIHQFFVPGRSCQISDMALDSSGVLVGVLVAQLLWYRRSR